MKALNDKGVKAALISSGNGEKANREIMGQLLGRSHSNAKTKAINEHEHITLLYVTPEQIQTDRFRDAMRELHKKNQLTLFAVDEAHWYVVSLRSLAYLFFLLTDFLIRRDIASPAGATTFERLICV